MHESVSGLSAWESFYVIVGSSGGTLIGLQFVVITLIADSKMRTQTGRRASDRLPAGLARLDLVHGATCLAYGTLTIADVLLRHNLQLALFIVAAVALALLLTGIHNAWDTVTHIATVHKDGMKGLNRKAL